MMNNKDVRVFPAIEPLADEFARILVDQVSRVPEHGYFSIALSGGSTPAKILRHVAGQYAQSVDWAKIRIFYGDERCVPPESDESNYKMSRISFLDNVKIPKENIFRVKGESDPEREAVRYGEMLAANVDVESGYPRIDMVMLGLGDDGHTASIFPGDENALRSKNVCEVATHPQSGQKRITLTLPVINYARSIVFLVTGAGKAEMAMNILQLPDASMYPAWYVKPNDGELIWLLDTEAAAKLSLDK
jgi:6-phosphogluconolactonase